MSFLRSRRCKDFSVRGWMASRLWPSSVFARHSIDAGELPRTPLTQENCVVHSFAIGPEDSLYILMENGKSAWRHHLPKALHNLLNEQCCPPVDQLTLGWKGEWFVRFRDGTVKSNQKFPPTDDGSELVFLAFGSNDQYFTMMDVPKGYVCGGRFYDACIHSVACIVA